jgi:hypothetical protein
LDQFRWNVINPNAQNKMLKPKEDVLLAAGRTGVRAMGKILLAR